MGVDAQLYALVIHRRPHGNRGRRITYPQSIILTQYDSTHPFHHQRKPSSNDIPKRDLYNALRMSNEMMAIALRRGAANADKQSLPLDWHSMRDRSSFALPPERQSFWYRTSLITSPGDLFIPM